MTAKKRDTSQKRESIIEAAMQVFADEGYDGASMDRIADLAEASKRTVYNHFPSKEVLFQAVLDRFLAEAMELKSIPYDPGRPLKEQLNRFAAAETALVENPLWSGISRVLISRFMKDPPLAAASRKRYAGGTDPLADWIKAAVGDGRMQTDDPQQAAAVFRALIEGGITWPVMFQGRSLDERISSLKDELLETFLSRYGT